jgi:sulfur dioxygenase
MDKEVFLNFLTLKQAYDLWTTDPDLIRFVDLREDGPFAECRIPGSKRVLQNELPHYLDNSPEHLLFILIAEEANQIELANVLNAHQNAVILKGGFDDWKNCGLPLCNNKSNNTHARTQNWEITMGQKMIFHQLFESETSTYTYLLADPITKEAVIIDPVLETVDRDLKLIGELGLQLRYILDTHIHADHITGAGELKKKTGAKACVSAAANVQCIEVPLEDGQQLKFGNYTISALETPGHTDSCMSFVCEGMVFTGDALLIRGTGRTDFQQGSSEKLYNSITTKIFTLPDDTIIYPGHDYRGFTSSTVAAEKKNNPRIGGGRDKAEFIKILSELKLDNPKKLHIAVPANLNCGLSLNGRVFHPQVVNGIPEITPEDLHSKLGQGNYLIVDVRRPEEFNNEYGHVKGAKLVTLGPDLIQFLSATPTDTEIVFVCRSGGRSGQAASISKDMGFGKTINMLGGMIRWNELKLEVDRD